MGGQGAPHLGLSLPSRRAPPTPPPAPRGPHGTRGRRRSNHGRRWHPDGRPAEPVREQHTRRIPRHPPLAAPRPHSHRSRRHSRRRHPHRPCAAAPPPPPCARTPPPKSAESCRAGLQTPDWLPPPARPPQRAPAPPPPPAPGAPTRGSRRTDRAVPAARERRGQCLRREGGNDVGSGSCRCPTVGRDWRRGHHETQISACRKRSFATHPQDSPPGLACPAPPALPPSRAVPALRTRSRRAPRDLPPKSRGEAQHPACGGNRPVRPAVQQWCPAPQAAPPLRRPGRPKRSGGGRRGRSRRPGPDGEWDGGCQLGTYLAVQGGAAGCFRPRPRTCDQHIRHLWHSPDKGATTHSPPAGRAQQPWCACRALAYVVCPREFSPPDHHPPTPPRQPQTRRHGTAPGSHGTSLESGAPSTPRRAGRRRNGPRGRMRMHAAPAARCRSAAPPVPVCTARSLPSSGQTQKLMRRAPPAAPPAGHPCARRRDAAAALAAPPPALPPSPRRQSRSPVHQGDMRRKPPVASPPAGHPCARWRDAAAALARPWPTPPPSPRCQILARQGNERGRPPLLFGETLLARLLSRRRRGRSHPSHEEDIKIGTKHKA
eukprot:scaffold13986_cov107-Isochrysis_galbana.AAC.2